MILNVILLILKILGITLLVILGVALFAVMLILFVPVRYKGTAIKGSEDGSQIYAAIKASWFVHILSACYEYRDNGTKFAVKILGIRLKSSEERKKDKERRERKKELRDNKKRKRDEACSMLEFDDETGAIREHHIDRSGKTHIFVEEHEDSSDIKEVTKAEPEFLKSSDEEDVCSSDNDKEDTGSFYNRLFILYEKLSDKEKTIINRISGTIENMVNKLTGLSQNIRYYNDALVNDRRNREVLKLLLKKSKELLKALLPRRVKGHMDFGSDDPAVTGRFLATASVFYPLYGRNLTIEPYFDEQVFDFDLMLRGRIYIFTLVKIFLQLYLNRKVRRFINIMKKENSNG